MFMNLMAPQTVWVGSQPDDIDYTSESHFRSGKEALQDFLHLFYQQQQLASICSDILSQQLFPLTMDDQQWFQQMAADSGDEDYVTEGLYNGCLPGTDTSTPYGRAQTAAPDVSAVGAGRDFGPSHSQHNKEPAGNDQMYLSDFSTANAYTRGFGASYDPRQSPWQEYNTPGGHQPAGYPDCDGLSSNDWHSNMPLFGEPLEGTQVSPSSFSSSVPSSATSEAMAAMSLNPISGNGNGAGDHRANDSMDISGNSGNTWEASCPSTISPKMLRIHPSPTSSSESIHTNLLTNGDSDFAFSALEPHHTRSPLPTLRPPRRELPSRPAKLRSVTIGSSDSRSSKDKRPIPPQQSASLQTSSHKARVPQIKQEPQDDLPFEGEGYLPLERDFRLGRAAQDDFLVRSKLAGMTYREIRKKGNFTEAESTLRGRFRTLTKDKEARVRRPEWTDDDIYILKRAVHKLNRGVKRGGDIMPTKAPWGQVADYIINHGGSYPFGGATCHRKWKELVEEGRAGLD